MATERTVTITMSRTEALALLKVADVEGARRTIAFSNRSPASGSGCGKGRWGRSSTLTRCAHQPQQLVDQRALVHFLTVGIGVPELKAVAVAPRVPLRQQLEPNIRAGLIASRIGRNPINRLFAIDNFQHVGADGVIPIVSRVRVRDVEGLVRTAPLAPCRGVRHVRLAADMSQGFALRHAAQNLFHNGL